MIEVKNLSRVFNKGKSNEVRACDDISIKLEDTGFYVIFGKSGAGKSSFMNALGGLDDYSSGTISYDGKSYKHMVSDKCRVRNIGYIFQNYLLDPNVNVYDNVAFGLRSVGIRDEEVIFNRTMTALANVGMSKYYRRNVTALSGGQQQRVAIARAMAKGSKIILADEPTGNLDDENTRIVMNILKELSKTRMVIVVTHEVDIVETYADKIIEIHDGKIVNESTGLSKEYEQVDNKKIFLKELEKETTELGNIVVEKYGDDVEVNIKVINVNGKLYLQADNANIRILDNTSEVKLIDSTHEEYKQKMKESLGVSLKDLEPIEPKSSGKVFKFKDIVVKKKGHTKKHKRRNGFLKVSMALLSFIIIFVSAAWGAVYQRIKVSDVYRLGPKANVMVSNITEYEKMNSALAAAGIQIKDTEIKQSYDGYNVWIDGEQVKIPGGFNDQNNGEVSIKVAGFESKVDSNAKESRSPFKINVRSKSLLKDMQLLSGASTTNSNEVVVSTGALKYSDEISIKNDMHFKPEYETLLKQAVGTSITYNSNTYKITGVVEDEESLVFFNELDAYKNRVGSKRNIVLSKPGTILKGKSYNNELKKEEKFNTPVENDTVYIGLDYAGNKKNYEIKTKINGQDETLKVVFFGFEREEGDFNTRPETTDYFTKETLVKFGDLIQFANENNKLAGEMDYYRDAKYLVSFELMDDSQLTGAKDALKTAISSKAEDEKMELYATSAQLQANETGNDQESLKMYNYINIGAFVMMIVISLFVMFANFMERTKEVGIYRAIGVSKGNVIFKYFAESLKTVISFVFMFILILGTIMMLLSYFPLSKEIAFLNGSMMYFTWWQLLGILGIMMPFLMFVSIIPPMNYVRKSPIKILSEYDM